MATKTPTKAQLITLAVKKLRKLKRAELHHFVYKLNCCPHDRTHPCGMDSVCDDCGAWV